VGATLTAMLAISALPPQRGYAQLESAERLAVTMGAAECAERPFEPA
jgi:hypothetical protein